MDGAIGEKAALVGSESDDRTTNNTVRHQYRVLSDAEKAAMVAVKDAGRDFIDIIAPLADECPREHGIALRKIEEAVMWAVKGITG